MVRILYILLIFCIGISCQKKEEQEALTSQTKTERKDYIRTINGEDEILNKDLVKKGKVLIAYSDCYDCHSEENRAKGPAFRDIAKRYPANQIYVEHLAGQVIRGSSGSWGYPVMTPHAEVKKEDARAMATFILSLRSQ
ncbi:c-type cytochrome [Aquiflexum sp. TKW24L]|uniref:c-type cytochrome n=1 Tax=Aquiflexum sp. TKW24L TaxID=2942212 RepID=UPI0020BD939B|nr:c-type cytochrome [Aquiflexum sp. TKW24L]MCL6258039.1 c-type cytochrome [Aquiflexum sp. TKW24L]